MKKAKLASILLISLLALSPAALSACGKNNPDTPSTSKAPKGTLTLSETSLAMASYETHQLTATLDGSSEAIQWVSDDPTIASVDQNGLVTAQGKSGVTDIKAIAGELTASCRVSVTADSTAPSLLLNSESISLAVGGSFLFSPKVLWGKNDITSSSQITVAVEEGSDASALSFSKEENGFRVSAAKTGEVNLLFSASVRGFLASAEAKVSIHEAALVFDPEDHSQFQLSEGGYSLQMARVDYRNYKKTVALAFDVYLDGQKIQNPSISWSISDSSVASISGDTLNASTIGKATLTGHFVQGANSGDIVVSVSVVRPRITLSSRQDVEVADLHAYALPEEVMESDSGAAYLGDEQVGSFANRSLTLEEDKLPTSAAELGEQDILLQSDDFEYVMPVRMVTLIVDNKAEFDRMLTLAMANDPTPYFADGYFLLGSDIDYNGTTEGMVDKLTIYQELDKAGLAHNSWGDGRVAGFKGVFDGQGHVVKGLGVIAKVRSGTDISMTSIFGTLHTGSVIKNVFFTQASVSAEAAYLCTSGDGTVSNVYVQYDSIGLNPWNIWGAWSHAVMGRNYSGTCFTWNGNGSVGPNAKIEHLVVDATGAEYQEKNINGTYSIYLDYFPNRMLSGEVITISDNADLLSRASSSYKGSNLAEVKATSAGSLYLQSFNPEEWTTENGVFLPKAVLAKWQGQPVVLSASVEEAHAGDSFDLTCDYPVAYFDYEYDHDALSIEEGKATIAADYDPSKGPIKVKAVSRIDPAMSAEVSIEIKDQTILSSKPKSYLNESLASDGSLVYGVSSVSADLSEASESGALLSFAINGQSVEGASFANNTLTLPSSAFGTFYGDLNCLAHFADQDVRFSWTWVSETISDQVGLDSFFQLSKALEPTSDAVYGGYFELSANIAYRGTFNILSDKNGMGPAYTYSSSGNNASFADTGLEGFVGVFDGMGYAISNLSIGPGYRYGGFISVMGNKGVLRNVAFTNFQQPNNAGIVTAGAGTIENVYVERTSFTDQGHREGLFYTFNATGLYTGAIQYRNVFVNDTAFNKSSMDVHSAYALTGLYTKNATLDNVFLATSDKKDLAYFANNQNGGASGASLNALTGQSATVAETYALASEDFKTEFDAVWQSGSGVILSDGTTR